jgi:hypothetical protein
MSDAFDLYLTNGDEDYKKDGYKSRYEKAKALSNEKNVAFIDKSHYESFEETKKTKMNIDENFIFLYRDPRDAILSYFYFMFYRKKNASRGIIFEYLKQLQFKEFFQLLFGQYNNVTFEKFFYTFAKYEIVRWKSFYQIWVDQENTLALRYEDIVNDTEKSLKEVAKFFNLDFRDDKVRECIQKWSLENTKIAFNEIGSDKEEQMARNGRYGEWQEKFDKKPLFGFTKRRFKMLNQLISKLSSF